MAPNKMTVHECNMKVINNSLPVTKFVLKEFFLEDFEVEGQNRS